MLILKRKVGESIVIGEDIEILVLEQDGDAVRLGIKAPRNVSVYRKEIYQEIQAANLGAVDSPEFHKLLEEYRKTEKKEEK